MAIFRITPISGNIAVEAVRLWLRVEFAIPLLLFARVENYLVGVSVAVVWAAVNWLIELGGMYSGQNSLSALRVLLLGAIINATLTGASVAIITAQWYGPNEAFMWSKVYGCALVTLIAFVSAALVRSLIYLLGSVVDRSSASERG